MSEAAILKSIRGTASRRATADETKRKATDDLREFVRQARAQDVAITKIASAAGLSRQAVYDVLGERPVSMARSKSPILVGTGISRPLDVSCFTLLIRHERSEYRDDRSASRRAGEV